MSLIALKLLWIPDAFREFSTKYGLDSEIVTYFCESFATHVYLPKEKWFKYHPPVEELLEEPIIAKDETIIYNVDPVVPAAYIEKPPFPVRIKEHTKVATVVNKSNVRTSKSSEQIKVEPNTAMVKDLLVVRHIVSLEILSLFISSSGTGSS